MSKHKGQIPVGLERDIDSLHAVAESLMAETIASPLIDGMVQLEDVSLILRLLRENLASQGKDTDEKLSSLLPLLERRKRICELLLGKIDREYINQIISKANQGAVFRIVNESNEFEKELRRVVGRVVHGNGSEGLTVGPREAEALLQYKFSIGTPPITPQGIETIEHLVFGGRLRSISEFRNLLSVDGVVFDRFLGLVSQMVEQSTHYTTTSERAVFESEVTDFVNFEGLRGFKKVTISGTADTAVRLIKEHLLSQYANGSRPLNETCHALDDDLLAKMEADKKSLFVVRLQSVSHNVLSSDILLEKWKGVIGRLVIVDESPNARGSSMCFVATIQPEIKNHLEKFHIKDSGTPANTQMNMRRMLQYFSYEDLRELQEAVQKKMQQYEREGVHVADPQRIRKQEWQMTAQKDYLCLKGFLDFLNFLRRVKSGEDLEGMEAELRENTSNLTFQYFFKALEGKGYCCVSVPQGGGRRQLGLVGKFFLQKSRAGVDRFQYDDLRVLRERLEHLKARRGVDAESTSSEDSAQRRAFADRESRHRTIRNIDQHKHPEGRLMAFFRSFVNETLYSTAENSSATLESLIQHLDEVLGVNIPGYLKVQVTQLLKQFGIEEAAKMLERGLFRDAANRLRGFSGTVRRGVKGGADLFQGRLDQLRRRNQPDDLELLERLLNDIEHGSFRPNLALADVSWTFSDVLSEDDYPSKNVLQLTMNESGDLDSSSLKKQLESMKDRLADFPELFRLYCSSTLLIINDPHNPSSKVMPYRIKLELLDIASEYGLTILSDEAYRKQVSKEIKAENGDVSLSEFYEMHRGRFSNPITIYTSLPTTKWAMGAGRRTGVVVTNDQETNPQGETFAVFADRQRDATHSLSLYLDQATLKAGVAVKKACKALEGAITIQDPLKVLDSLLGEDFCRLDSDLFCLPLYEALVEARNDLDHLQLRAADWRHLKQYTNMLISRLKNLRLDKQTQRDSAKRSQAAIDAIKRVEKDFPGIEQRCIKPEGPFYFCFKLDEQGDDPAIQPFLEAIARSRKIDVVPRPKGYVRFAFGGMVDGTREGYEMLSLALETDLRLLLKYWKAFREKRAELNTSQDLNPIGNALKDLFPGGEIEFARAFRDKSPLIEAVKKNPPPPKKTIIQRFSPSVSDYLTSIEPDSPATIVTLRNVDCKDAKRFVRSRAFQDLFNHYLLQVRARIPALKKLKDDELVAYYGAHRFADKFDTRDFNDVQLSLFQKIAGMVAQRWYSDDTIKILALQFSQGTHPDHVADSLLGAEKKIGGFINEFLKAFLTEEQEKGIKVKPSFQVGYQSLRGIAGDARLPSWARDLVARSEFAGQTMPTDPSPEMITGGTARVAGFERGIYRRDGDGNDAPQPDYFRYRLQEFVNVLAPNDYVCKMVQVGPSRLMLVMNRSYSHYLAEELRLFPQTDVSFDDLKSLRPDGVSFLGIPSKVMGEDYRIGYFFDQYDDTHKTPLPVSWVDSEEITNYMGYLKKPILTNANERVKAIGGLPVHGSALTIELENGLRKTFVLAGDSGTGKSETIIAMVEQVIEGRGGARKVKSIELLSGDMLSLFTGDDGQIYLLGTESGDFMRMTDISENWQQRFRDKISTASKTNKDHPKNPRTTISRLCNENSFLRPTRVNMFYVINNFEEPPGGAFQEEENPVTLMTQDYPKGYRREKGTSGDQPNLFASVKFSKNSRRSELFRKYHETLDDLLGWDVLLSPSGKARNGILKFREVAGKRFEADQMVRDLFKGQTILEDDLWKLSDAGGQTWTIEDTDYDLFQNQYQVALRSEHGEQKTTLLDRAIFDRIYNPIASTYCGNPFIDPRGMESLLRHFGEKMKDAGVITGTLYTQLAVKGRQFSGPARASQDVFSFIQRDPRINERLQKHCAVIQKAITTKYGGSVFQQGIPEQLWARNLLLLERQESDVIHLVESQGKTISLRTPYFTNHKPTNRALFNPTLMTTETEEMLLHIIESKDYNALNLEDLDVNTALRECVGIRSWENRQELVYQILLAWGNVTLGNTEIEIRLNVQEVKKAEKVADAIMKERQSRHLQRAI